jgi:hypothetical protein
MSNVKLQRSKVELQNEQCGVAKKQSNIEKKLEQLQDNHLLYAWFLEAPFHHQDRDSLRKA